MAGPEALTIKVSAVINNVWLSVLSVVFCNVEPVFEDVNQKDNVMKKTHHEDEAATGGFITMIIPYNNNLWVGKLHIQSLEVDHCEMYCTTWQATGVLVVGLGGHDHWQALVQSMPNSLSRVLPVVALTNHLVG